MATSSSSASSSQFGTGDARRQVGSPRPKGRDSKDTLCRNVLIYGHCRYEDRGCAFNHDPSSKNMASQQDLSAAKRLNVESPAFTPSFQPSASKKSTLSSQAANAAPFTPRAAEAAPAPTTTPQDREVLVFNPAAIRDFTPSNNYDPSATSNGAGQESNLGYDHYSVSSVGQNVATQFNPYAGDHGHLDTSGAAFFGAQGAYNAPPQPTQYHLYAPNIGARRDDLLPYQRQTRDFFISDKLRESVQRRLEASLQVMPNSQLPVVDAYHSLVALDTSNRKNASTFGYPSWVYKAVSGKNGKLYCLRRLEGFRLTNEHAIMSVRQWKKVSSSSVVHVHDAFTTRAFGDSSIIFVQDYHPLSKTLLETHFPQMVPIQTSRSQGKMPISESILWTYIVQIATALKAIHSVDLAARCVDLGKIILTDKNRIRLNACSILDVVKFETGRSVQELQQDDFVQFGKAILSLAITTPPSYVTNIATAVEQMSRNYSQEFRDTITWLLTPSSQGGTKKIDDFVRGIAPHIADSLDSEAHAMDTLSSELYKEVENGRLFRLVAKLGTVNERGEFDRDPEWSETGERYLLKLFRDYVFHQVDAQGKPVVDPGHIVRSLNKLDAGIDERICLTSRDNQTVLVVSYKDLKKALSSAFADLTKGTAPGRAF